MKRPVTLSIASSIAIATLSATAPTTAPSITRITKITRIHPCRHNCHGWPSAGEKSLQLINTPHIPQMMAKPRLNVSFLSYSYPHRLFHLMPCTSSSLSYMHHNPSISDLSFCSCKPRYMLLLELFDSSPGETNQSSITTPNSHPPLNLLYNLTPSSLHVKLPPSFPVDPNSIPTCPILYIFLWKPTNHVPFTVYVDRPSHELPSF